MRGPQIPLREAPPPFFASAACSGLTSLMYGEDGPTVALAKKVCADCPVLLECREYAIDNHEQYGTWGGLSERERRIRRRNRKPKVTVEKDYAQPTLPLGHGTREGYLSGCRLPCCMAWLAKLAIRNRRDE